ncbi:MAG: hypothetical protein AAB691_03220 [Patescibacteria group bacterium]
MSVVKREKTSPAVSFWQRLLLEAKIITLAKEYRRRFEIPVRGFSSFEDFERWRREGIKKNGSDKGRIANFNQFEAEAKKIAPYRGVLSDQAFRKILVDFYYLNELSEETLDSAGHSELKVKIINEGKQSIYDKNIEGGVYIKIGAYTPISVIKKFVQDKKDLIRSAQEIFAATEKISKPPKLKSHINFKRDELVSLINDLGTEELRKLTPDLRGRGIYKEHRIVEILRAFGYPKMSVDNIKAVLQRRRRMDRALWE